MIIISRTGLKAELVKDMHTEDLPTIWIKIPHFNTAICGIYRQFSSGRIGSNLRGEGFQKGQVDKYLEQISIAESLARHVIVAGDMNLDLSRSNDNSYGLTSMLKHWVSCISKAGLVTKRTHKPTFKSHGVFGGTHRTSEIDHVYVSLELEGQTQVEVLPYAATDHFPVIATLELPDCLRKARRERRKIERRQYKM